MLSVIQEEDIHTGESTNLWVNLSACVAPYPVYTCATCVGAVAAIVIPRLQHTNMTVIFANMGPTNGTQRRKDVPSSRFLHIQTL